MNSVTDLIQRSPACVKKQPARESKTLIVQFVRERAPEYREGFDEHDTLRSMINSLRIYNISSDLMFKSSGFMNQSFASEEKPAYIPGQIHNAEKISQERSPVDD